jgi:hypothetical protein
MSELHLLLLPNRGWICARRTFMGMPASASAIAAALMQAQRVPPSACSTCTPQQQWTTENRMQHSE